jgi:hypothetical protein
MSNIRCATCQQILSSQYFEDLFFINICKLIYDCGLEMSSWYVLKTVKICNTNKLNKQKLRKYTIKISMFYLQKNTKDKRKLEDKENNVNKQVLPCISDSTLNSRVRALCLYFLFCTPSGPKKLPDRPEKIKKAKSKFKK